MPPAYEELGASALPRSHLDGTGPGGQDTSPIEYETNYYAAHNPSPTPSRKNA